MRRYLLLFYGIAVYLLFLVTFLYAIGLIGMSLQGPLGGQLPGMMTALGPMAAVCFLAGLVPVVKMRRWKESSHISS